MTTIQAPLKLREKTFSIVLGQYFPVDQKLRDDIDSDETDFELLCVHVKQEGGRDATSRWSIGFHWESEEIHESHV